MLDNGTNGDVLANDGIYSAFLPFQSSGLEVKFYIRSENSDAIKLNPQRAEYEFYIYSPISNVLDITLNSRSLIGIKDALGREIQETKGMPLFYMYDDGSVERRVIIE